MHRDARLTPTGRRIMIEPIAAGPPQAHVAQQTSVSRRRCRSGGDARSPKATRGCGTGPRNRIDHRPARRNGSKNGCVGCVGRSVRGPPTVAMHTGGPASTVHKILVRPDLDRLARIDRPTGRVIRRHERARPGELIHPAVGKVAGIPPGGGPRVRGRGRVENGRVGCTHLPCAVDDRSRVACVEAHDDQRAETPVGFRSRAQGPAPGPRHDRRRRHGGQRIELPEPAFSPPCRPDGQPGTAAPARTGPDPTARWSGSTGPSPTGSSTRSRSDRTTNDDDASTAGSTTTTITATTPPSADHQPHASTTSVAPPPSRKTSQGCRNACRTARW